MIPKTRMRGAVAWLSPRPSGARISKPDTWAAGPRLLATSSLGIDGRAAATNLPSTKHDHPRRGTHARARGPPAHRDASPLPPPVRSRRSRPPDEEPTSARGPATGMSDTNRRGSAVRWQTWPAELSMTSRCPSSTSLNVPRGRIWIRQGVLARPRGTSSSCGRRPTFPTGVFANASANRRTRASPSTPAPAPTTMPAAGTASSTGGPRSLRRDPNAACGSIEPAVAADVTGELDGRCAEQDLVRGDAGVLRARGDLTGAAGRRIVKGVDGSEVALGLDGRQPRP